MEAVGTRGILKVGHNRAVSIRDWKLTLDQEAQLNTREAHIVAKVAAIDEFWSTCQPTELGLDMGVYWWVWDRIKVPTPIIPGTMITMMVMGDPMGKEIFD